MATCKADVYGPDPSAGNKAQWHKCGNRISADRSDGYCALADTVSTHRTREVLAVMAGEGAPIVPIAAAGGGVADLDALLGLADDIGWMDALADHDVDQMRDWLLDIGCPPEDLDDRSDGEVIDEVERKYVGGVEAFLRDGVPA